MASKRVGCSPFLPTTESDSYRERERALLANAEHSRVLTGKRRGGGVLSGERSGGGSHWGEWLIIYYTAPGLAPIGLAPVSIIISIHVHEICITFCITFIMCN